MKDNVFFCINILKYFENFASWIIKYTYKFLTQVFYFLRWKALWRVRISNVSTLMKKSEWYGRWSHVQIPSAIITCISGIANKMHISIWCEYESCFALGRYSGPHFRRASPQVKKECTELEHLILTFINQYIIFVNAEWGMFIRETTSTNGQIFGLTWFEI